MKEKHVQFSLDNGIRIKNRTFVQWLIILVALWSVLMRPVSSLPGVLGYLKYAPDGILFLLLLLSLRQKTLMFRREILANVLIVLGFFVYCLVVYLLRYQSIAYFLWGFRNNFRLYIAFFVFIAYLDVRDVSMWFKVMDVLFWVNAVVSVFQFVVLGIRGDYLGGIFGIQGATNGYTLGFMSIVIGKTLLESFDGSKSFWMGMLKCVASIGVAAMAELKIYFFMFPLLMIAVSILTRFSLRKLIFLILGFLVITFGAMLLVNWFGFQGFLSLKELWLSATKDSYASQGDINRLSAIPALSQEIMKSPIQRIFGLGLGNCDTSAFAVCNTPFYQNYGYLHYTWFTAAMIFLETGYLGLVIYSSFFVVCFLQACKRYKTGVGNLLYNRLAIMMSLLCVVLMVYNASLRTEPGYMIYFVLATPFICSGAGENKASVNDS